MTEVKKSPAPVPSPAPASKAPAPKAPASPAPTSKAPASKPEKAPAGGSSEATGQAAKGAAGLKAPASGHTKGGGSEAVDQAVGGAKGGKVPATKSTKGGGPADRIPDGAVADALARQGIKVDAKDLERLKGAAAGDTGAAPTKGSSPKQEASKADDAEALKAEYLEGDVGNGLNPDLEYRLALIGKDLGEKVTIESGNRTYEEQEQLYAAYQAGTGNLAAVPGTSNHEGGNAADVYIGGTALRDHSEGAALAEKYGLGFPVSSESWHTEIVGEGPSAKDSGPPAFMVPDKDQTDEGTIKKFVEQSAEAYGVNPKVLTGIAERESGYDVGAKNDWDINAQNGHPSEGLMQFIPDTFDRISSEARDAKPELWKELGEPDFTDWRQQALAAAYGVKNGNGPEWATYDDAVAAAGGTVEIKEKRFKGVEHGTPTGASEDSASSSTTSSAPAAPAPVSSSSGSTAPVSSSGPAASPAPASGGGGSSSGGSGSGGGSKRHRAQAAAQPAPVAADGAMGAPAQPVATTTPMATAAPVSAPVAAPAPVPTWSETASLYAGTAPTVAPAAPLMDAAPTMPGAVVPTWQQAATLYAGGYTGYGVIAIDPLTGLPVPTTTVPAVSDCETVPAPVAPGSAPVPTSTVAAPLVSTVAGAAPAVTAAPAPSAPVAATA